MGNWSPMRAAEERVLRERRNEEAAARQAELDRELPPMERPCGTPGAVYTIVVDGRELAISVALPFDIEAAIPAEAKETMKQALHDAVLPIVERFYRDVWEGTIAGKCLDGDTEPMPARWELLFAKWLRRCLLRGEQPTIEGQWIWGESALPNAYRWDRP